VLTAQKHLSKLQEKRLLMQQQLSLRRKEVTTKRVRGEKEDYKEMGKKDEC
jgi:hypothetical protein